MRHQEREEAEIGRDWHLRMAYEAERAKHWFAAAFHLKQLLKQEPDNGELKKRLRKAEEELDAAKNR